jgi:plasmid stabilization system protein ParE
MIYTVVWTNAALNSLADIWNRASDRQAVSEAANRIDRDLRIDADRKGQNLGDYRLLRDPPLVVTFTVDAGDCKVTVLNVRRTN